MAVKGMGIEFNPRSLDGVRGALMSLKNRYPGQAALALKQECENIAKDARDNYVPVEDGDLRDSIRVVGKPPEQGGYAFQVVAGNAKTQEYAIAVHEHLSDASPPTWQAAEADGRGINWTKAGTGPKFLEKPFFAAEKNMLSRLAHRAAAYLGMGKSI